MTVDELREQIEGRINVTPEAAMRIASDTGLASLQIELQTILSKIGRVYADKRLLQEWKQDTIKATQSIVAPDIDVYRNYRSNDGWDDKDFAFISSTDKRSTGHDALLSVYYLLSEWWSSLPERIVYRPLRQASKASIDVRRKKETNIVGLPETLRSKPAWHPRFSGGSEQLSEPLNTTAMLFFEVAKTLDHSYTAKNCNSVRWRAKEEAQSVATIRKQKASGKERVAKTRRKSAMALKRSTPAHSDLEK